MKYYFIGLIAIALFTTGAAQTSLEAAVSNSEITDQSENKPLNVTKDIINNKTQISKTISLLENIEKIVDYNLFPSEIRSNLINNDNNDIEQIPGLLRYENPEIGLSIYYPSHWDVDNFYFGNNSVRFISPLEDESDIYFETLDIVVYYPSKKLDYYTSADMPLEEIGKGVIKARNSTAPSFEIQSLNNTVIAGHPAIMLIYTYSDVHIGTTKALELLIATDDRFYDIVYYAKPFTFVSQIGIIKQMLDTLQLEK